MRNICKETRSWPAKCVMMNCFQTRFLPRYKDIDQCRCFLHSVLHSANLILLWLRSWLFQVNMNYDRKTNVILFLNRDKFVSTIRSEYDFINVYYYHQNFQNINRKLEERKSNNDERHACFFRQMQNNYKAGKAAFP